MTVRKFRKVSKTKKGVPKYVAGAKNRSTRESEILRTKRRYKLGLLTPAEMDRISKQKPRVNMAAPANIKEVWSS